MQRDHFLQPFPKIGSLTKKAQLSLFGVKGAKCDQNKKMILAGADEAGRGPWAGPVVAAVTILPERHGIRGLKDSKMLSAAQRERLFAQITAKAAFGIGIATHTEIDTKGLIAATNLAFQRAINELPFAPDFLLVDGRDHFILSIPFCSIIKGDQKYKTISAASILAKVTRDCLMQAVHTAYPYYGFNTHIGYGTARHHHALLQYGVTPFHRRSFLPIKALCGNRDTVIL